MATGMMLVCPSCGHDSYVVSIFGSICSACFYEAGDETKTINRKTKMSEQLPIQEALISEYEVLEGLSLNELVDHVITTGIKMSELENHMQRACQVLEGAHGTTMEAQLQERENV